MACCAAPTFSCAGAHVFADVDAFLKDMALDAAHPFKSLLNLSQRNPYVSVAPGTPLIDVARLLSSGSVHRVAVELAGKIVKLISQSHIVDILAAVCLHFNRCLLFH